MFIGSRVPLVGDAPVCVSEDQSGSALVRQLVLLSGFLVILTMAAATEVQAANAAKGLTNLGKGLGKLQIKPPKSPKPTIKPTIKPKVTPKVKADLPTAPTSKGGGLKKLPELPGSKKLPDAPGVKKADLPAAPGKRPRSNADADLNPPKGLDDADAAATKGGKWKNRLEKANMLSMPVLMGTPLVIGQVLGGDEEEDKEEKKFDENGNPIDMEAFDVELFKYQIANGLPHTNRR